MAEVVSKTISAGDPVTSDLINNIIKDLRAINNDNTSQSIIIQNALESKGGGVSSKVYYSSMKRYVKENCLDIVFNFTGLGFTSAPKCWVQIDSGGVSLIDTNLNFGLVLHSVSTTEARWKFYAKGVKPSTLTFHMFAAPTQS